jgi:hypothetical protein
MKNVLTLVAALAVLAPAALAQKEPQPQVPVSPAVKEAPAPVPPVGNSDSKETTPDQKAPTPAK